MENISSNIEHNHERASLNPKQPLMCTASIHLVLYYSNPRKSMNQFCKACQDRQRAEVSDSPTLGDIQIYKACQHSQRADVCDEKTLAAIQVCKACQDRQRADISNAKTLAAIQMFEG